MVILVAGALSSVLGILAGVYAKDSSIMFAIMKGSGIFLFAPTVFYIFPEWPQWIAKLFPLYWIIEPIWQVSVMARRSPRCGSSLSWHSDSRRRSVPSRGGSPRGCKRRWPASDGRDAEGGHVMEWY